MARQKDDTFLSLSDEDFVTDLVRQLIEFVNYRSTVSLQIAEAKIDIEEQVEAMKEDDVSVINH